MLFSRENQARPQACNHPKAISSAIEQPQRKTTRQWEFACIRIAGKI
jgi:hypothetical protein